MNANHQSDHFQTRHHPRKQRGIQGGGRSTPGERANQYQHTNQRRSFGDAVKNAAASARRTTNHGTEQSRDRNAHDNSQPDNNHYHSNNEAPPMEQSLKCMTAVEEGSRIAFACYDEEKNEILLEESPYGSSDSSHHDLEAIVQTFTGFVRPNLVLISSKVASNPLLLDFLTRNPAAATSSQQHLRPNGEVQQGEHTTASAHLQNNTSPPSVNIPYQLLKTKSFDLKQCKHIILHKLRVMSLMRRRRAVERQQNYDTDLSAGGIDAVPGLMDSRPSSKYHSIASIVNFDSTCLLRALGSLLCFLQGTVFRLEEGNTITVNSISYARSSQYMRIDKDTLHSLHIFSTEHHPLTGAKGSGKDKEGFSLFTLLDRTKSKMGRECLKEWMMKPLLDPASIRERQNGVALFLHPFCRETSGNLLNHLSKVGAVDKIIQKMQKCHSVPMDFIVLSRTLAAAVAIYGTLNGELRNRLMYEYRQGTLNDAQSADGESGIWQEFAVVEKIIDDIHLSVLQDLHDRIVSIVDHEATMEAKESVVIHYGFHEELDRAKELFENLDETLSKVGSEVLEKYPALSSLKVVFLPQVGFLIAVDKRNHLHNVATNEFPDLPPDFSYVFIQEEEAFFKNPDMRRLDEEIGDLDAFIKDTEKIIVSELEEDILDCECELRCTFSALASLDCLLAFANCAADHNFVRPEIIEPSKDRGCIFIENGRHPLQELIVNNEFIPNDTKVDNSQRINIVTGPNFSGKSCYIRQVGMLVFMSHVGSYIPCDQARISITDQILARISSIETCAVPQSSFQLDLTQMATILHRSTPNSLVLIDEFGKGTSPVSGIAVLTAALKKLTTIGCSVICTTHFLEIFSLKLLSDGHDSVKVLHMAVHIPDCDDKFAVPLFKLEQGTAKSSAGVVCAKMAGVHVDVISRAREILGALKNGHQVKPIPAKLNSNSVFQAPAKRAIRHFLGKNSWKDESDTELEALQREITLM